MRKHKWQLGSVVTLTLGIASTAMSWQAAAVNIDQPYAGDRNVTGQDTTGSVPLTVYEVNGGARSYLGKSSSLDQQGFYAVNVDPTLVAGHQIVVVDALGHSSNVVTVLVKTGPAGPTN